MIFTSNNQPQVGDICSPCDSDALYVITLSITEETGKRFRLDGFDGSRLYVQEMVIYGEYEQHLGACPLPYVGGEFLLPDDSFYEVEAIHPMGAKLKGLDGFYRPVFYSSFGGGYWGNFSINSNGDTDYVLEPVA